ncbi:STAS domain-containing protein [bacterium]|nr:STAS domain-containing protein [bacterium]
MNFRPAIFNLFFAWLSKVRQYDLETLRADVISGGTITILSVPQSMAYAVIAGVPPVYGLYTSMISCIIGALAGSSSHLVTGPTNASSLLLFTIAAPYFNTHDHMEMILLLTVLTGLVKLSFGLLRLGGVVRYVSNSVVTGLTAGAGILIAGNQLRHMLGVSIDATKADQFYEVIALTARQASSGINVWALLLGLFTMAVVIGAPRIHPKLPGPFLGVALSAAIVYLFGWYRPEYGVSILRDLGEIKATLNIFHFPEYLKFRHFDFLLLKNLFGGAMAVAILGLIEASSSSRAVAASSGQRLNFSREFIGQGIANIGGAFFLNFAGSGSFTRTALCYQSGGRTRMAPVYSAVFTALVLMLFAPLANWIPTASLAGMLMVIAYKMVHKERFRLSFRSGAASRMVLLVTVASTLVMPLQYAIFVGVFLSIVFLLKVTGTTDLTLLVPREGGKFEEVPYDQAVDEPIVLVNMEGDLYFAAVENLDTQLTKSLTPRTRAVILRMKRLRAVGSSAMAILQHFYEILREKDIYLVVCGIEKRLAGVLERSGLRDRVGEQNIFYADNTLFQSTELALARAQGIIDMERSRGEAAFRVGEAVGEVQGITAGDLLSRQVIRFGQGHSLREAVWLLSEMQKRAGRAGALPLFLQGADGRLFGSVSPWQLLQEMTADLKNEELETLSDEDLGRRFRSRFHSVVGALARRDVPRCGTGTKLSALLRLGIQRDLPVLPICDGSGRVIGMVSQTDLLVGLGNVLGLHRADPHAKGEAETDEEETRTI